jgi:predicted kinase
VSRRRSDLPGCGRRQHRARVCRYARNVATLHFIYGWPGAGKTTLARALGEHERAVVFCEDEWLAALATGRITSLDQFVEASARIRRLIAPLAARLLALGVSVVFDFAGNTPSHRAWVKAIADATSADHLLHVLDVPADECKRRLHERNAAKPEGLYFGDVSDELFEAVVQRIVPPRAEEAIRMASAFDPGRWPGR